MNSLQDPSKKTSINSLLNPQEASAFPAQLSPSIPPNQAHPHDHHSNAVYASSYPNNTSFHLRAASWDISDDLAKRKHDNGTAQHRHYQQSSVTPQQMYADPSAPRLIRQRIDPPSQYSVEGQPWNSQQDVSGMNNYNAPVISPMYSGERSTAMSTDYQQHNNYNQSYQEQPTSSIPPASEWQKTERVSVRLSARASLADHHHQVQQQQQQHQQHPQQQHHPSHHHTQPHPSHHQSHSSSQSHQLGSHQQHGRYNAHPSYYPQHGAYAMSSYPSSHHTQPLSPQGGPQPPPQVPPQPQNPEATSKRPLPDADSAPVKKRSRAKKTVGSEATPGPSRRGYNAKKRSEAAQIAAQNAHLIPTVSYTQVPSEKGKGKDSDVRMQMTTGESTNGEAITAPLHPELQFARCMSNRYRSEQFPRCVSCTRRWAGDTCRFQGIRFFLKDQNRNIVGISFVETQKADAPTMNFPSRWNIPFTMEHIKRTKKVITQALLPTLRAELEHLKLPEIIRRPRECEVRATCDTCMTSLFSSSWMCRLCGREACGECFAQVRELTTDKPGATPGEIAALQAKRDRHAHSNPFFLSCTRRNEHQEKDFSPMSRFCREELEDAIKEMEELSLGEERDGESGANDVNGSGSSSSLAGAVPATVNGTSDTSLDPDNTADPAFQPMHLPEITASIPSHPIRRYSDAELASTDKFARIWALGQPLVISNVLSRFKLQWTPDYFMEKYKEQSCLIMECQTDQNKRVTVGEFFGWFGQYEDRKECWKLKDWPPSTDFKTAFPELYEDFSQAVPIPDYVRRDGVYNIGSHFPSNSVGPDLGPKMYNAMASSFSAGSKGSTKLHMDMADALNIMTYAAPCANGTPGYAAWDLFRAEDSDRLRSFLKRKFGTTNTDPIHTQTHYLDETLRDQLWKEAGVLSYRVYQRPGEAVFIPAGCAHQVANMSDCMKVAIDYVSPENIARCERLTKEFREQNQSMAWKEDVLQLRTMMWFAWLSCCQQERQLNELKGVKVPPGVGEAAATD